MKCSKRLNGFFIIISKGNDLERMLVKVMLGYHKNSKATADMIDADGWLRTGDIGYYDEESHFYVQDRLKELIKVKGFQVTRTLLKITVTCSRC